MLEIDGVCKRSSVKGRDTPHGAVEALPLIELNTALFLNLTNGSVGNKHQFAAKRPHGAVQQLAFIPEAIPVPTDRTRRLVSLPIRAHSV